MHGGEADAPLPDGAWRFVASYVLRRRWRFALLFALVAGGAACAVGVQFGMKLIVDAMTDGDRRSAAVWRWLGLFIALISLESILWRAAGWLGSGTIVATGVDVRLDLFRHLSGHAMRYFAHHPSGALGGRITATAGATGALLGSLTWHILPPCIDFLGAVVVLAHIAPSMSFALIAFASAVAVVVGAVGARGRGRHQAYARQGAIVNGQLIDVVANMWTVKAFSARRREHRRLRDAFGAEADSQRESWRYLEKTRMLHDLCLWVLAGSMLAWAVARWRSGQGTPGDVVVISALSFRILHGSRDLALSLVDASQQFGVIAEMLRVVATPHRIADPPDAPPFRAGGGAVRFDDVTFGYGGAPVFEHFSLDIPAGQRVGIVGPSGAGKSTLLALIQRLDDVDAGELRIDGQPVRSVAQDSLRAAIAVVPQDIALLDRSVADNVRYGRPDASDAEVRLAARHAHADSFIDNLPEGFDTPVGERGVRLSGGQRQRIGMARAFLKNADLLLLDEATSALDSESEAGIQRALVDLMQGRTVIAVAHRLSTVAAFDRIVVLDAGRVVEDGPPAALRRQGGLYAHLWRLQSEAAEV